MSLMGRRRLLPNISSPDWGIRMQAERQAVNFVVQGRSCDTFTTGQNQLHSVPAVGSRFHIQSVKVLNFIKVFLRSGEVYKC